MSRILALLLGVAFLAAGALGVAGIANPVVGGVGSGAIFETNAMHDYVHIGSGVLLLLGAFTIGSRVTLLIVGVVYALVAVAGFVFPLQDGMLFGMVHLTQNDKWLHVGLAAVLLIAGLVPAGGAKSSD